MSKPLELIIANCLHSVATDLEALPPERRSDICRLALARQLGRMILSQLSHDLSDHDLMQVLKAAGGPSSLDELLQRLDAVQESRRQRDPGDDTKGDDDDDQDTASRENA